MTEKETKKADDTRETKALRSSGTGGLSASVRDPTGIGGKNADDPRETKVLRSATLAAEQVPRRILLAPWGDVESTNGSFVVDDESARLAVAAFEEHGTDLPIDFEHQTLGGTYASPTGQAPAAGWIKRVFGEPGVGLLAEIEWTGHATDMLASRQYRYLSPVAIIRKSDRKLVAIHSAALTNKPAIVGMQPIVNRAADATDAVSDGTLAKLCAELDLPAGTEAEEVLVAAGQRLEGLKQDAFNRHIEQRVQEALRTGRLVAAQRSWAERLVARDEGLFDEWLRVTPVVVTPGVSTGPTTESSDRPHQAVAAKARAQFRAHPELAALTTEEAYVADALRQAGPPRA